MFDDDAYHPVESAYREAYEDATVGSYQAQIRETVSGILGQEKKSLAGDDSDSKSIGTMLASSLSLVKKLGVSESTAIIILGVTVCIGGPAFLLIGASAVSTYAKQKLNRTMKDRYGDSFSVDATMKTEESVEAPDDDDEEEDDESEDDEDDE